MTKFRPILYTTLSLSLLLGTIPSFAYAQEAPSADNSSASSAETPSNTNSTEENATSTLQENSWRYKDGELITLEDQNTSRSRSSIVPWSLTNNGYVNEKGEVIPNAIRKGIDVSENNGVVDWDAVKADGIDFAIIRCGYGSNYTNQDDDQWLRNVQECERLGIPYGVYLYSYARSVSEAASEADHVLRLIKGHNLKYPVYYDLEENSLSDIENRDLLASIAKEFTTRIANAGYTPGVYANLYWWNNYLTDPIFNNWDRWVAQYNSRCDYTGDYSVWQSSQSGKVAGINGSVDVNFEIKGLPSDVDKDDWYVTSGIFTYAITHKLMTVYSDSELFGPYDTIKRGQVATILWRMAGEPTATSEAFSDVDYSQYYGPAIYWARSTKVINGYETFPGSGIYEKFGPDDDVTREQLTAMLANYASKVEGLNTSSNCTTLDKMPDAPSVSSWARQSIGWAMDKAIISGDMSTGQALINPQGSAWRSAMAKMATILDRDIISS